MATFQSLGAPSACFRLLVGSMALLIVAYSCMGVHAVGEKYIGWHRIPKTGGPYEELFYPTNDVDDEEDSNADEKLGKPGSPVQDKEFMSGLQALEDIVEKAASDGKRLRPYGSRWSYLDQPYTDEYMIACHGLNYAKIGIENDDYLVAPYDDKKEFLTFVQAGVTTKYLYEALFAKGLTLSTSGKSDGQTIIGAVSTGTHNACLGFGAMSDFVKGIHLVIEGKTVFLQKASDPVVTDSYRIAIGADMLMNDDDLFLAALVSLGTFGVVHGFLIETEKLFRLKIQTTQSPCSEAYDALYSLDLDALESLGFDLGNPPELPWHFESNINPYQSESKNACLIRIMQKVELSNEELEEKKALGDSYELMYHGIDMTTAMTNVLGDGQLMNFVRLSNFGLIPNTITRAVFGFIATKANIDALQPLQGEGYPPELYGDDNLSDVNFNPSPITTIDVEVGVPLSNLSKALPLVMEMMYEKPSPTSIALRYVKGSSATLAPSKFDDVNVFLSIPGAYSTLTKKTFEMLGKTLEAGAIPFTYHWGKYLPADNNDWVEKSYGPALGEWKDERENFLDTAEARRLFSSDFTDNLGLTT